MNDFEKLAELLFPAVDTTVEELEVAAEIFVLSVKLVSIDKLLNA